MRYVMKKQYNNVFYKQYHLSVLTNETGILLMLNNKTNPHLYICWLDKKINCSSDMKDTKTRADI